VIGTIFLVQKFGEWKKFECNWWWKKRGRKGEE
jgi:hypothetical protein